MVDLVAAGMGQLAYGDVQRRAHRPPQRLLRPCLELARPPTGPHRRTTQRVEQDRLPDPPQTCLLYTPRCV